MSPVRPRSGLAELEAPANRAVQPKISMHGSGRVTDGLNDVGIAAELVWDRRKRPVIYLRKRFRLLRLVPIENELPDAIVTRLNRLGAANQTRP